MTEFDQILRKTHDARDIVKVNEISGKARISYKAITEHGRKAAAHIRDELVIVADCVYDDSGDAALGEHI